MIFALVQCNDAALAPTVKLYLSGLGHIAVRQLQAVLKCGSVLIAHLITAIKPVLFLDVASR